MEIRKLFGQTESQKNAAVKKQQGETEQQASGNAAAAGSAAAAGNDVVSFSRLSRQLLKVADIVDEDNKTRVERVAEIKRKVSDGSYSVSSTDVAQSIVSYASDLPAVREA